MNSENIITSEKEYYRLQKNENTTIIFASGHDLIVYNSGINIESQKN